MRRDFLKTAALTLLAATVGELMTERAGAAAYNDDPARPAADGRADTGPFPLPVGAWVERNVAYGSEAQQQLDVYHPAKADGVPLIFMVHGGAWSRGSKDLWRVVRNKVTHWVGKGYLFVSTNYRMSPQADPVAQAHEVARALAFVQSRLSSWGADPDRLIVMGHSSGAHLVSLLSADPAITAREGIKPWCATVALDSAAMDVEQVMRRQHFKFYDRIFTGNPSYWREASPTLRLAGKPVVPMLLVCSSQRMDSCPQAQAFAAKARRFGGRAEVLPVDLTHPEINDYLGSPGAYTASIDSFLSSVGVR